MDTLPRTGLTNTVPRIFWSTSDAAGSCSCCTRHYGENGTLKHRVLVIEGASGTMTRICVECVDMVQNMAPKKPTSNAPPREKSHGR